MVPFNSTYSFKLHSSLYLPLKLTFDLQNAPSHHPRNMRHKAPGTSLLTISNPPRR
jgi:hypothetical protein